MQETLRALREQWKQADQGGVPNHALWKRFDEACNEAHKVVEAWLDKVKAEAAEHRAQRLALIEEVKAWAADARRAHGDWKALQPRAAPVRRPLARCRPPGEKAFAELQPQWKEAFGAAARAAGGRAEGQRRAPPRHDRRGRACWAPRRMLRIDAVKALQQRWQAEAQAVPLDRKHEQKLWDAFRKPIDEAFNRKTRRAREGRRGA